MYRVLTCTLFEHNLALLALAASVCVASFIVAAGVCAHIDNISTARRTGWIACLGLLAGGGTWATHFIAMLAFHPPMPFGISINWTLLSLVIAVAGAWVAFALMMHAKPTKWTSTQGGIAFAATVSALHFFGMLGLDAGARHVWAMDLVAAACLACAACSLVGAHAAMKAHTLSAQLRAHAWFVGAVLALHFMAMGAMTLTPNPLMSAPSAPDSGNLSLLIAVIVAAMLFTVTLLALTEQRIALSEAKSKATADFLATMSHELRTPLTSIISCAELMAEIAEDEHRETDKADAETILKASKHLLRLISEILDFSKLEADQLPLTMTTFQPLELINEIVVTAAPLISRNGNAFCLKVKEPLDVICTDKMRLGQCILNLLSNAAKFTSQGTVSLVVEARTHAGLAGLCVEVGDTGVGIRREMQSRIFDPFTQADETIGRVYGGTGLGLAITKELVTRMGGTISLASEMDVGSTFSIWLPLRGSPQFSPVNVAQIGGAALGPVGAAA